MSLLDVVIALLQMTMVLLAAGMLARRIRVQTPDTAATVATLGLVLSLLIVVLAVSRFPRPLRAHVRVETTAVEMQAKEVSVRTLPATENLSDLDTLAPKLSIGQLLSWLAAQPVSTEAAKPSKDSYNVVSWATVAAVICIAFALANLLIGLVATVHLHLVSEPMSEFLERELIGPHDTTGISFRQSQLVHAPCVTFVGVRTIYLPRDWRDWSPGERSAAIAHEIAHLRRRDPAQRLLALVASSLQAWHPLAHWLRRSAMLSQEMAADRQASEIQGSDYVNNLSRMALRLDSLAGNQTAALRQYLMRPGMVSVASSHLIRRIEMLKEYPAELATNNKRLAGFAIVMAFVICAGWCVQADQPTEHTNEPAERIANLPKDQAQSADHFAAVRLSPWEEVLPNDSGYGVVRLEKLRRNPFFAGAISGFLEPALDTYWQMMVPKESAEKRVELGLGLDNVRSVIVCLKTSMEKKEGEDKSRFNASSDGGVIDLIRPVDHDAVREAIDLPRLAERFVAALPCEQVDEVDQAYTDKNATEVIEEILSGVFTDGARSDRLSLQSTPKEKEYEVSQAGKLKQAWRAVDGGSITVCFSLPDSIGFVADEQDRAAEMVFAKAAAVGFGVDFDQTMSPANVRVALVPRDGVTAEDLNSAIERLVQLGKQQANTLMEDDDEDAAQTGKKLRAVLATYHAEVTQTGPGDQQGFVLIRLEMPIDVFATLGVF